MLTFLLVVLLVLWVFGNVRVTGLSLPDIVLFYINSRPITLWNILTVIIIGWLIRILPSPLRQIASIILVIWILSILGVLAVAGLSNILVLIIIIGLILFLFGII